MNDPWHQETLDGLVAFIEAAKQAEGTAWAVVVVSSERLGGKVIGELGVRLQGVELLRLCTYVDPRHSLTSRLEAPARDGFQTVVVEGLGAALEADRRGELLPWLNFRREEFERAGEAFVFVLSREVADRWSKQAADLNRYMQWFEFVDWDDLVEAAGRSAESEDLVGPSREEELRRAEARRELTRGLGVGQEREALDELAYQQLVAGLHARAIETLVEIVTLTGDDADVQAILARSDVEQIKGHPEVALRMLENIEAGAIDEAHRLSELGDAYFRAGQSKQAFACAERLLELRPTDDDALANMAEVAYWWGEIRKASTLCERMGSDRGVARANEAVIALTTGAYATALDLLMRARRDLKHSGFSHLVVHLVQDLASMSLDTAAPLRAVDLLDEARSLPGSRSTRSLKWPLLWARTLWILHGPAAVSIVVEHEEQRQQGWTAPIPAAELAHVRAFAAASDHDARHHFQDAADRYRSMEALSRLSEIERSLARLDRLEGDLDRATERIDEGLTWHVREGTRPWEARDRIELAMISLGRAQPSVAQEQANLALQIIRECGIRLYEPAALVALAAAERAQGSPAVADAHDERWRRLVRGIDAKGLEAALERDASWAKSLKA